MIKPHINVPLRSFDKYLHFIRQERLNLEIYFDSNTADKITKEDILLLKDKLDYKPELSIHAPFMDLSPGGVDPKVREITFKRFSDLIGFSEILKPKTIVFHSGYDKWKYDSRVDIWLEGSLKTWRPLNKMASDLGVNIAIENVFEDEPSHLRLLMEEMGSGNFGLCFDAGHFNLFSSVSLKEWLRITKPYILELHLHDNDGGADSHLAIGEGNVDFQTLFNELKEKNCLCTIEAHTIEGVKKSIENLQTFLK